MVMELVEGTNLSQIVKTNGALPPDQVAPILAQVADALAAAHSAGIVHRDVKPSNILVTPDGNVKLTDFGIARSEADAALTQTGLVTGSPAYLAPEVATGRSATEASDMWSFGATLCHALTGQPPYDVGDNVMGALYRIVNDEPPRPASAGWLAPVLAATMVKDPAQRWSAAQAARLPRGGAGRGRDPDGHAGDPRSGLRPPPPPPPSVRPAPTPVAPAPVVRRGWRSRSPSSLVAGRHRSSRSCIGLLRRRRRRRAAVGPRPVDETSSAATDPTPADERPTADVDGDLHPDYLALVVERPGGGVRRS